MVLFVKETSRHFEMLENIIWGRSAENSILMTYHLLRFGKYFSLFEANLPHDSTNQIHDLGDRSLVWNFYVCSTDIISWVIQSWHHTSHCFLQWGSNNVKFTEGHIWSTGFSFLLVWWLNQFDNWCGHSLCLPW